LTIIHKIREKVEKQEYEFTIPHFFEEMTNDHLTFSDIEMVIAKGLIRRKYTRDPRGTRYEVVGPTTNGRERLQSFVELKAQGRYYLLQLILWRK